jgi:inward rectifier potassium channel
MSPERETKPQVIESNADYEIQVIGAPRPTIRDFYFNLVRLSWPRLLLIIVGSYLTLNGFYALGYLAVGGVEHMHPWSFADAYFFSIQTMGTIGYGGMVPETLPANLLVVAESVTSLLVTALSTGILFHKFSLPSVRVMFGEKVAVATMNGKPTLFIRIGNLRSNRILDATIHVALARSEKTAEGQRFYRLTDLELTRSRIFSLARSWSVMHVIDESSPLANETPASLEEKDAEISVSITGIDDTWMQTVHANYRYMHHQIAWGHRQADILSEDGRVVTLDLRRFHELVPEEEAGAKSAEGQTLGIG